MEHPDSGIDPHNGRKVKRSNTLFGWNTIYGRAGEHDTPYMTRAWLKQLRLHIFHRGDADPDCHDHPWDFWTFPLTSYVEEVVVKRETKKFVMDDRVLLGYDSDGHPQWRDLHTAGGGQYETIIEYETHRQVVPAFRFSFRPSTHCHRVLGRYVGIRDLWSFLYKVSPKRANDLSGDRFTPEFGPGRIITIVWRSGEERKWGFLKHRDGRWRWIHWKDYVFGGGKDGPCQ